MHDIRDILPISMKGIFGRQIYLVFIPFINLCRNEPPSGTLLWNSYCLSLQMVPSSPTVPTVGQRENMQKHHTWPPLDDWGDYRGWGATKPLIHLDPNLKQLIFSMAWEAPEMIWW